MPVFVLNAYQYFSTFWKLKFLSLQNFHCIFVWCHAHCIPKGVGVEGRGQDITCAWIWEALRVKLTHSLLFDLFLFLTLYHCMCWFSLFKKARVIWEGGASTGKMMPSDWSVGESVGHFLYYWLMWEGQSTVGGTTLGRWSELVWQSKPRVM